MNFRMDSEAKSSEPDPRRRQITLGMMFGAVVFFAIALLATRPELGQIMVAVAVVATLAITLIMTNGASARGTAIGIAFGCALAVVLRLRNGPAPDLIYIQAISIGITTWIGTAIGAAESGHRFVAWSVFCSWGLFLVLAVTSQ